MGKRSSFERRALDGYATPFEAVPPLIVHLDGVERYIEPCSGDGDLVGHLGALRPEMVCALASDIKFGFDALTLKAADVARYGADAIISNVPWERGILHAMIERFAALAPSWLLFDADWAHTTQAALLMTKCSHIVAVGRVKWVRDSPYTGKENACWYKFSRDHSGPTKFYGRHNHD